MGWQQEGEEAQGDKSGGRMAAGVGRSGRHPPMLWLTRSDWCGCSRFTLSLWSHLYVHCRANSQAGVLRMQLSCDAGVNWHGMLYATPEQITQYSTTGA